ncbi:MAG TPA: hypothetical protein IGS17_13780 [Oscillatoriales cyanobacterium M59_W2019_021]|nr:hypothetical protein [Oscillatoriales cyanobacterium M4454_W2019_049]HIK51974.1 hypothetical protein [Oscillatoriales cyanobacterium M59_W2019_021]
MLRSQTLNEQSIGERLTFPGMKRRGTIEPLERAIGSQLIAHCITLDRDVRSLCF